MINVANIVTNPDFAQAFDVHRVVGGFTGDGEWSDSVPLVLNYVGVILPAKQEDAQWLPEGARLDDMIVVYAPQELRLDDAHMERSDVVIWHGRTYRVMARRDWSDFGYWQAWAEGFRA